MIKTIRLILAETCLGWAQLLAPKNSTERFMLSVLISDYVEVLRGVKGAK
jgi:hypothetical protein